MSTMYYRGQIMETKIMIILKVIAVLIILRILAGFTEPPENKPGENWL